LLAEVRGGSNSDENSGTTPVAAQGGQGGAGREQAGGGEEAGARTGVAGGDSDVEPTQAVEVCGGARDEGREPRKEGVSAGQRGHHEGEVLRPGGRFGG
jgi:hypothetical protein